MCIKPYIILLNAKSIEQLAIPMFLMVRISISNPSLYLSPSCFHTPANFETYKQMSEIYSNLNQQHQCLLYHPNLRILTASFTLYTSWFFHAVTPRIYSADKGSLR